VVERAQLLGEDDDSERLWTLGEVKQLTSWDTKTLNKRIKALDIEIFKVQHDKRFKFIKEIDIRWLIAVFMDSNVWDWSWGQFWERTKQRRWTELDVWSRKPELLHMPLSELAQLERSRMYYKKLRPKGA